MIFIPIIAYHNSQAIAALKKNQVNKNPNVSIIADFSSPRSFSRLGAMLLNTKLLEQISKVYKCGTPN